mgnify:CR=1 FL=1
MDEMLQHYGVKGMKWGVRRTPEQLDHRTHKTATDGSRAGSALKKKVATAVKNKFAPMSDDELQRRINRLNLEERYANLVSRQKARESSGFKSTAKKLLGNAAEDLGRQLLSKAVTKLVDRIAGDKKDKFDIRDFEEVDVKDMDADTIAKVSKWYGDALKINSSRSKLTPTSSGGSDSSESGSSKPASSSKNTSKTGTSKQQLDDWIRERNRAMRDLNRRR